MLIVLLYASKLISHARLQLAVVEHLVLLEGLDDLGLHQLGQRVDGVAQVEQAALARPPAATRRRSCCR